jgi:CDGSH-type Zn-finger protein
MSVKITIRDNGPYVVEGEFTLVDAQGNEIPVRKRALCRCGGSTTKPFCDGTHSKIGFQGAIAAVEQSEPKP